MLIQKLREFADKIPEKTAVQTLTNDGYELINYSDLYNRISSAACKLADFGLKAGDHIAVYGDNSPWLAISILSIHAFGGVIVPLDAQLDAENVITLLTFSDSNAIIASDLKKMEIEEVVRNSDSHIKVISINELVNSPVKESNFQPYQFQSDDLMSIIFTSGTPFT